MDRFVSTLKDSLELFGREPKFIIPKLIIALLYSILLLMFFDLLFLFEEAAFDETLAVALLFQSFLILGFAFLVNFVDVFIGAMYPFLTEDVKKGKKLSLGSAFRGALSKAKVFLPAVIGVEILFILLVLVLTVFTFVVFGLDGVVELILNPVYFGLLIIPIFFLFYLLYPVIAFEKTGVVESLKRSVSFSLKNKKSVAKAVLLSSALSFVSMALAYLVNIFPGDEALLFWAAFIIVRILSAYIYAYLYVLNPVFYFNYVAANLKK